MNFQQIQENPQHKSGFKVILNTPTLFILGLSFIITELFARSLFEADANTRSAVTAAFGVITAILIAHSKTKKICKDWGHNDLSQPTASLIKVFSLKIIAELENRQNKVV